MSRGMTPSMPMRLLWILLLALACGPALALGLGQIEVKSRHGQPLLAEIPIVSSDPSELEQLQARLASPETFARVGLQPPSGLVSDLRFAVALDPRGRPVIRVTTDAPVQQPLLTFLVEVDWGQGRLVREYAALVETPETVASAVQPPIQAPELAPSNTIIRSAETAPVPSQAEVSPPAEPAQPAAEVARETAPTPVPAPVPTPAPVVQPVPTAVVASGALAPVQAGQTLSGIAGELSARTGRSLDQTMVALLRANPEAFIRGNINLLREGAVLRVPGASEWDEVEARQASAVVREHVAQWRELRRPVPQPAATADATATAGAATARRTTDARLEIVPPSGGANQAGTRSGIATGGEGDMLRQQELTEARETIAARNAEVDELKARVADLEQLQQQQAQLIELKDSELAAAQQRLAESNAQTAPIVESTVQSPEAAPSAQLPWIWIGVGFVALALLALWWASRRSAATQKTTRSFLASAPVVPPSPSQAKQDPVEVPQDDVVAEDRPDPAAAMVASGWSSTPAPAAVETADATPPWHAGGNDADRAATIAPLNPAPAGRERLELARAYLDLGDVDTARTLLQEVADTGDAASRGEAARLLRELV